MNETYDRKPVNVGDKFYWQQYGNYTIATVVKVSATQATFDTGGRMTLRRFNAVGDPTRLIQRYDAEAQKKIDSFIQQRRVTRLYRDLKDAVSHTRWALNLAEVISETEAQRIIDKLKELREQQKDY